jgi:hypothetical protein
VVAQFRFLLDNGQTLRRRLWKWKKANQQLGYPFYVIPLIGVTHIFGGVGLLIPNVPRFTQWVYAGLVINLALAFYSQLNVFGGA